MGKKKGKRGKREGKRSISGVVEVAAKAKTLTRDETPFAADLTPEILQINAELSLIKKRFEELLPLDPDQVESEPPTKDLRGSARSDSEINPKAATAPDVTLSKAPFVIKGEVAETISEKLSKITAGDPTQSQFHDLFALFNGAQSPLETIQDAIINAIVDNTPFEITDEEIDSFLKQQIDPVSIFAQLSSRLQARILTDDPKGNPKLQSVSHELLSKITSKLINSVEIKKFTEELMAEFETVNSRLMEVMSSHNYLVSCIKVSEARLAELNAGILTLQEDLEEKQSEIKILQSLNKKEKSLHAKEVVKVASEAATIAEKTALTLAQKDAKIASLEAALKAERDVSAGVISANKELQTENVALKSKPKKRGAAKEDAATQTSLQAEVIPKETQAESTEREMQIAELKKANADLRVRLETAAKSLAEKEKARKELREQIGVAAGNLAASIQYLTGQAASMTDLAYGGQAGQPSATTAPEQVVAHGGKANIKSQEGR